MNRGGTLITRNPRRTSSEAMLFGAAAKANEAKVVKAGQVRPAPHGHHERALPDGLGTLVGATIRLASLPSVPRVVRHRPEQPPNRGCPAPCRAPGRIRTCDTRFRRAVRVVSGPAAEQGSVAVTCGNDWHRSASLPGVCHCPVPPCAPDAHRRHPSAGMSQRAKQAGRRPQTAGAPTPTRAHGRPGATADGVPVPPTPERVRRWDACRRCLTGSVAVGKGEAPVDFLGGVEQVRDRRVRDGAAHRHQADAGG